MRKKIPPFKRGTQQVLPCLGGGGRAQRVSDTRFSHFVAPPPHPLPVINDQSLIPGCDDIHRVSGHVDVHHDQFSPPHLHLGVGQGVSVEVGDGPDTSQRDMSVYQHLRRYLHSSTENNLFCPYMIEH